MDELVAMSSPPSDETAAAVETAKALKSDLPEESDDDSEDYGDAEGLSDSEDEETKNAAASPETTSKKPAAKTGETTEAKNDAKKNAPLPRLADVVSRCSKWSSNSGETNPLAKFLGDNRYRERGWLRKSEALHFKEKPPAKNSKQFTERETLAYVICRQNLNGVNWKTGIAPAADLAHAWGRSRRNANCLVEKVMSRGFSGERSGRSDKGQNIFNSEGKRTTECRPKRYFAKYVNARDMTKVPAVEINREWTALTPEERKPFEEGAKEQAKRAANLKDEIIGILERTKGKMSYANIAKEVNAQGHSTNGILVPIVSANTVMDAFSDMRNEIIEKNRKKRKRASLQS